MRKAGTERPSSHVGTGLNVMKDGHLVSRQSDFIIYSVEAEFVERVVSQYGPCKSRPPTPRQVQPRIDPIISFPPATKVGAIVSGQTSVKDPERAAFEKYLPADVDIISVHSLHGPTVPTDGQALVRLLVLLAPSCASLTLRDVQILIQHRGSDEKLALVERILAPLNSRYVHMSYAEHDEITANTQAVTHAAFLS